MAADEERMRARLEAHGVAPTAQRLKIAALVLEPAQHVTAEQVLARLSAHGERVSKATVYNTLNLFAARGLLRELCVDPARAWFDSNTAPHFHMQHVDTGELVDLASDAVAISGPADLPAGTEAAGIEIVIRVRRKAP